MGLGTKEIARRLDLQKRKTPKQLQDERCGKGREKPYRWTYQSVHNILSDASYTGLLANHKTETHGRAYILVPEEAQYRHENFYPPIVSQEEWGQTQKRLKANARPYCGNQRTHRYAGLLTCGDCGSTFIPKIRRWNGKQYVAYVCNGYMHHGKDYCPSHSIREAKLDAQVRAFAETLRSQLQAEQDDLTALRKRYDKNRPAINASLQTLTADLERLEQKVDGIIMERMKAK